MKSSVRKFLSHVWLCFALCLVPELLSAQTYTDLRDFDCSVEGCDPEYPAILAQGRDGNLYGTTNGGGTKGMGTVFKMSPAGVVMTLYNFSGLDGQNPNGGLVLGTDGNFYGTTRFGGTNNLGTVFKITPGGTLTTIHSFSGTDGSEPRPGLVQGKSGTFYGTTCGFNAPWTAYSVTSSGKLKTIISTATNGTFSAVCFAPLTLGADGNLYGAANSGGPSQQGMVFRLSPAGALKSIFAANGFSNGTNFEGGVVQGNDGLLYGTAAGGGPGGFGVVYKLSLTGKITLLHSFGLDLINDGFDPSAGLVAASDGKFYGATQAGQGGGNVPNGNLFSVTTGGTYNMLHAFDGTHGRLEQATPMQHTNGKIYGTAIAGGAHDGGVIYSLDTGAPQFVKLVTRWGSPGQPVEILGQGFTNLVGITFGSAAASFNVVSDTYMTALVPPNGTTGFVTVTTQSRSLISSQKFFVTPIITGFTPASGAVGAQVTISGGGFVGTTVVKFGTVKATAFSVDPSGMSITATVPTGATTGKIAVTTPGGTATSKAVFTVL